jgi:hypothetical protein
MIIIPEGRAMKTEFLLIVSLIMILFSSANAQDSCDGLVTPRLEASSTARIIANDGIGVVFRDGAGTSTNVIDNLPEGEILTVTGNRTCADGFVWWPVRRLDGTAGFVAEGGAVANGYFLEPFEIGLHLFFENGGLEYYFVDAQGRVDQRTTYPLEVATAPLADVWQPPEVATANEQLIACTDFLPPELAGVTAVESLPLPTRQSDYYPSPDGEYVLAFHNFLLSIPDCTGQDERFGTTYVTLVDEFGETSLFPFSQHSNPPTSPFCQPPFVDEPAYRTYIENVVWSPAGNYAALEVRYLRDSDQFPCAYYHIFLIDVEDATIQYVDVGQRVGWTEGGRRLYYIRNERTDPNTAGIQRMLSVRPGGGDVEEITLPEGTVALGHPLAQENTRILLCMSVDCTQVATFSLENQTLSTAVDVPYPAGVASIHYASDQLVWLGTAGQVVLQSITTGELFPIANIPPVADVQVMPLGLGVVLQLDDGRFFFLDTVTSNTTPIGVPSATQ